jgi:hypothetical protein
MQGSVKVPGGEVYALPAKRPLTRPPSSGTLSPGRGLSFLVRVEVIKTALSLGQRVASVASRVRGLLLSPWALTEPHRT